MDTDKQGREMRQRFEAIAPPAGSFDDVARRIRRRRTQRRTVGIASVALLTAAILIPLRALLPLSDHPGQTEPATGSTFAGVAGVNTKHVAGGITDVVTGFGSVWVTGSETLSRLDSSTGDVVASIDVPGSSDYRQVAVGDGEVWVSDSGKGAVFRVDPISNALTAKIDVGGPAQGLTVGGGFVWVAVALDTRGEIVRIDTASGRVTGSPIVVPDGPRNVNFLGGYVWVESTNGGNSVTRIDPSSLVTDSFSGAVFPEVSEGTGVWSAADGVVSRVDVSTGQPLEDISVPRATDIVSSDGILWVLTATGSTSPNVYEPDPLQPATVQGIDPTTGQQVGDPIPIEMTPGFIAAESGVVWFGDFTNSTLTRIELATT